MYFKLSYVNKLCFGLNGHHINKGEESNIKGNALSDMSPSHRSKAARKQVFAWFLLNTGTL